MWRRVLIVLSAACAVSAFVPQAARAADLEVLPAEPVIYVPTVFQWGGIYIGGYAGAGWGNTTWRSASQLDLNDSNKVFSGVKFSLPAATNSISGFAGGGQIGFNYQVGSIVFGAEGAFTGMVVKGSVTDALGNQNSTTVNWAATVSARVGYTINRFLAYGKFGAAVAQDNEKQTFILGTVSGTATRFGYVIGGGLEYAFDRHWSVMVEYDHLRFNSQLINFPIIPAATLQRSVDLNIQWVVGGINYRF